jgi:sensor histidine kinase regulating citrate/malate metabolism
MMPQEKKASGVRRKSLLLKVSILVVLTITIFLALFGIYQYQTISASLTLELKEEAERCSDAPGHKSHKGYF